ncbi:MAG: M3 family oligoendopeptidase [Caldilineaceae bacterium]|nr:M3 family oligoendopeptidase [Caldilineaceae bacterium]
MTSLPHWDLSTVYPSLESAQLGEAEQDLQRRIDDLAELVSTRIAPTHAETPPAELAGLLGASLDHLNDILEVGRTVRGYLYSFFITDSRNRLAAKKLSAFEQRWVRVQTLNTQLQAWVGRLGPALEQAIPLDATAQAHAFTLRETAEQARYLMSEGEEGLAAELALSGATAWRKLHRTVTSQLTVAVEVDGQTQTLPITAVINLRSHPDEATRRRGYEAENTAWAGVGESLAAALNSVKGASHTLNRRRKREDDLHPALDAARIDRPTLEAMLAAMKDSFPMFRRYFKAKARLLGKEQLPWWDLFAPVGKTDTAYTWPQSCAFVLEHFAGFSPDLEALARRAFDRRWIDAEPRESKAGGAFCMGLPAVQESRILANFDGSLDGVSTIAHELGHAYHSDCRYRAGKTELQSNTPMTLAETASILCETLVMQAVLDQVQEPQTELAILETILNGQAQIIVDIYSRYLFEQEVFVRRAQAELSVEDFCAIMEQAQRDTYGDGLDAAYLQKYMWTWKPHYYDVGLSFYNFPYAFGLLFSTGLYAIYRARGAAFVPDYEALLASTGEANAADLAARFGIDIRSRGFWDASLATIGQTIDRYCALADATA